MESPLDHRHQQVRRIAEVTGLLAEVLTARAQANAQALGPGTVSVVVDGRAPHAAAFADVLAERCSSTWPTRRLADDAPGLDPAELTEGTIVVAAGARWRAVPPRGGWDAVVYLRTAPSAGGAADRDRDGDAEHGATVVVDYHDPAWPVIRRVHPDLTDRERWYLPESQAFFAARAATWDTRFGDDMPAYAAAVAEAELVSGCRVADVGCGTGRALPALRAAVGPDGTVLGIDVTAQMLDAARRAGRDQYATLLIADARRLPLATASLDAIFAAGLVNHLPDAREGLRELARATRPNGQLVIFHPSGRAALAARHGRTLRTDEPLDRSRLEPLLAASGWRLRRYDDPPHRFLAVARRTG